MEIQPITRGNFFPSFKIYKKTKVTGMGSCDYGVYKNKNIEIFTGKEDGKLIHKLFYISDQFLRFIKSKLIYFENGNKKVVRCENHDKSIRG